MTSLLGPHNVKWPEQNIVHIKHVKTGKAFTFNITFLKNQIRQSPANEKYVRNKE